MQVLVNGTDITNYIVVDSYEMDSEQSYEAWTDGNKVEHRIVIAEKVKGSFKVALSNKNEMPISDFLTLWNSAVSNNYVTITVYVTNKAANKTINAYYTMKNTMHQKLADSSFLDVLEIEIQER